LKNHLTQNFSQADEGLLVFYRTNGEKLYAENLFRRAPPNFSFRRTISQPRLRELPPLLKLTG